MLIIKRIAINNKDLKLEEYLIAVFDFDAFPLNLFQEILDLKVLEILIHLLAHYGLKLFISVQ
jgi:hypothetical protein